MAWDVDFHSQFLPEFGVLDQAVQDKLYAHVDVLKILGPQMGRPRVDTLADSKHANMKELRFEAAGGVWRFAFAFDPVRKAIILCGGQGRRQPAAFLRQLIDKADRRFDAHLAALKAEAAKSRAKEKERKP